MNLQFYKEKLEQLEEFQKFKKENPTAYFCSAFFSIDKSEKTQDNKQHLDFYVPEKNQIFSFQLEESKLVPLPIIENAPTPEKLVGNSEISLKEIEELIIKKMQNENITNSIQKILFSFQPFQNKDFWIGTIFISGLGMIKTHIDDSTKQITHFEKKSLMDMVNIFKK